MKKKNTSGWRASLKKRLCLSSLITNFGNGDSYGNENIKKKTHFARDHAFLNISLLSMHDYDVKTMSSFPFYEGHEQPKTNFYSSF